MNIISMNYDKILKEIAAYNGNNYNLKKPVILMNDDTLKLVENEIKSRTYTYLFEEGKSKSYPTFYGAYVASANWLPLGEVEIR